MPALPSNNDRHRPKVLLTSATGYVGQWVLKSLLGRGYNVRVAVRSEGKAKVLQNLFEDNEREKLQFVVVNDLTKAGAFDEAVVGVDAVVHVASAAPSLTESPEEILRIAKEATLSVLRSSLKNGKDQEDNQAEPRTFSETDWNGHTLPKYESGQRDPVTAYFASKILAERAVWQFVETHKQEVSWDVAVLNVPFVFGPNLQPASSPSQLLSTSGHWFKSILDGEIPIAEGSSANGWIDVRDLGEAHVRCLERQEAGGERIIPCAGPYVWREWFDLVRAIAPSVMSKEKVQELLKNLPEPIEGEVEYKVRYDNAKDRRILGIDYRTKEEMVRSVLEQGVKEGWL